MRYPMLVLGCLLLAGCAIEPLRLPPSRTLSAPAVAAGTARWGGTIEHIANEPGWTRLEVRSYPLDTQGRPLTGQPATGRFTTRLKVPYDPTVYAPGRSITVTGRPRRSGSGPPRLEARDYYLWGVSEQSPALYATQARRRQYHHPPVSDCCYGGWGRGYRSYGWWWPSLFLGWGFRHGWVGYGSHGGWSIGYIHH